METETAGDWVPNGRRHAGNGRPRVTLLTGATGFLGRELLAALLARDPDQRVVIAVRPTGGRSADDRARQLVAALFQDEDARRAAARRVSAVEVDLAAGDVILPPAVREALAGHTCRLIHGAASVSFDLPLAEARATNVEGTRRMLRLAEAMAQIATVERFAYIGTAFVAGMREGTVYEDELDVGQRFTNSYERSKCEAEALVRSYTDRLPITVLRPSIVAGHSETGVTTSFKVLYWPLKAFTRRLVLCIPGDPRSCYDIVPVDFVVDALLHILDRDDTVGRSFHLTAGQGITLDRAVQLAAEFFRVRRVPPYVSPRLFWALVYPLLFVALTGRHRNVLTTGRLYIPYLTRRLVFDNRNTLAVLEGTGLRAPDVEAYLLRLFHYVRETDWGRLPAPGGAPARSAAAGADVSVAVPPA
jgi:thioester reductase-like protein